MYLQPNGKANSITKLIK